MQIPPAGSNPFDTKSEDEGEAEGEGERSQQVQEEEEEEEAFLEPELADRLPFMKQRSRHAIAVEEKSFDSFQLPPLMADEALRTCKCSLAPPQTFDSAVLHIVTSKNKKKESNEAWVIPLRSSDPVLLFIVHC